MFTLLNLKAIQLGPKGYLSGVGALHRTGVVNDDTSAALRTLREMSGMDFSPVPAGVCRDSRHRGIRDYEHKASLVFAQNLSSLQRFAVRRTHVRSRAPANGDSRCASIGSSGSRGMKEASEPGSFIYDFRVNVERKLSPYSVYSARPVELPLQAGPFNRGDSACPVGAQHRTGVVSFFLRSSALICVRLPALPFPSFFVLSLFRLSKQSGDPVRGAPWSASTYSIGVLS
jgi:hypothetical protein